jgi:hypothetical protein
MIRKSNSSPDSSTLLSSCHPALLSWGGLPVDLPSASTGDWPTVPPAPAPMRPVAAPLGPEPLRPEPPIINTDVHLITGTVTAESEAPTEVVGSVPVTAIPAAPFGVPAVSAAALAARVTRRTPRPLPPLPLTGPAPAEAGSAAQLGPISTELIWQPRFAIGSAAVILVALTIVTLPLWIVLYRLVGTAGTATVDILALCMMLLGAFLAAAAGWVVVVEMRARVRMVDTMARRAERELLDQPLLLHPIGGASFGGAPPPLAPRVEAQQVLEASSRLLASFSSVLKSFGQLWAQIAMLTVALALFAGATVLSLH